MRSRRRPPGGFTLIELIVAGSMLAIGIAGAIGALSACATAVGVGESKTQAVLLAQEKLTELETQEEFSAGSSAGDFGEDYPDYQWTLDIETVTSDDLTDLWRAQLAVTWEHAGRTQTCRVEQWFYRPTPTQQTRG
ncbi:MAG: hypothetical protein COZ06_38670 [Armatimonadetes bacterium CG_4_10_14_3_um_filter_66_18]|nr:hypothetical protein [Armatimonadota bacterium]PIU87785.1 MAG: hypothetical protein COS65_32840 [Armatimonadetes bacterium CG06_land_8_20_14_3_00_66_21]PIY35222.1 MAG: hypothetical protein COZ06_38670 [Armatimonadetes bacterium CG_4_10_14_3_um_filter_66_18]PJB75853.1 MAG: hypothetical protein CO096_01395 [Armatimonadetes bacterium CG_4_9_14_3_um_filter_66_14]NCQ31896.1 hypothetical protein [Armatimonadota bacterium]